MMFGNKKKESGKSVIPSSNTHSLNSLVHGTKIEGTLSSENDIRVDGFIKGTLDCSAKVIIGPSGLIEGEIRCQSAVIEGRFEGILNVVEALHIKEKAIVIGEIRAGKLIVQPGAAITGSFDMGGVAKTLSVGAAGSNGSLKSDQSAQLVESIGK